MAYTEQEAARLIALIQSVESHKEHPYAAPTYRDTPALQELDAMVHGKLEAEPERDQDTLQTVRKLRKALKNCVKSDIINI